MKQTEQIQMSWEKDLFGRVLSLPRIQNMKEVLQKERTRKTIYPDQADVFNAYKFTPLDQVKVVIIGQDPYHTAGVADGLAFSSKQPGYLPPSLLNIFKEINQDIREQDYFNYKMIQNSSLLDWATQGVLLLNSCLTVRQGEAGSHAGMGWEIVISETIKLVSTYKSYKVFMLWGKEAQKLRKFISNESMCLVLEAPHPMADNYNSTHKKFSGCKHFSTANNYLLNHGRNPIQWDVNF